jgi:hypothetical protein
MRSIITTALEVIGLASITAGAMLASVPAGLIVGGIFAVGLGYLRGAE